MKIKDIFKIFNRPQRLCRKHYFQTAPFKCKKCGWTNIPSGGIEMAEIINKLKQELAEEIEKTIKAAANGKLRIPNCRQDKENFYIDGLELIKIIKQKIKNI